MYFDSITDHYMCMNSCFIMDGQGFPAKVSTCVHDGPFRYSSSYLKQFTISEQQQKDYALQFVSPIADTRDQ
jgi:hypothetical protein